MKKDAYKIICEMLPIKKPVFSRLGLTVSSTGLRRAARIKSGQDPMHSRSGYKQSATKILKKATPQQLKSAGIKI